MDGATTWFLDPEPALLLPSEDGLNSTPGGQPHFHSSNRRMNKPRAHRRLPHVTPKDSNRSPVSLQPEAPLFVPATPRSGLLNALRAAEKSFSKLHGVGPIKFVERTGTKLISKLSSADLWGEVGCG